MWLILVCEDMFTMKFLSYLEQQPSFLGKMPGNKVQMHLSVKSMILNCKHASLCLDIFSTS